MVIVAVSVGQNERMDNPQENATTSPASSAEPAAKKRSAMDDPRLTVIFAGITAFIAIVALVLGVAYAGDTPASAFRSLTITIGALALIGAAARFGAHLMEADWKTQLDAAGKLMAVLAALVALILGIFKL